MTQIAPAALAVLLAFSALPSAGQEKEAAKPEAPKSEAAKADAPKAGDKPAEGGDKEKDKKTETDHSITLGGKKIDFTATAGTLALKDAEGKTTADIFYIAYVKKGEAETSARPLTFSFNGGPGSSSVWLHMGLLGPGG